jgi:hypothetical protein
MKFVLYLILAIAIAGCCSTRPDLSTINIVVRQQDEQRLVKFTQTRPGWHLPVEWGILPGDTLALQFSGGDSLIFVTDSLHTIQEIR